MPSDWTFAKFHRNTVAILITNSAGAVARDLAGDAPKETEKGDSIWEMAVRPTQPAGGVSYRPCVVVRGLRDKREGSTCFWLGALATHDDIAWELFSESSAEDRFSCGTFVYFIQGTEAEFDEFIRDVKNFITTGESEL